MGVKIGGAAAAALLGALVVVGCSASPTARSPASASTCYAFGVRALRQHLTVTSVPPACAGLSAAAVNQAVDRAVREVVGPRPKAAARRVAYRDGARLAYLIRTVPPAAAPPQAVAAAPGSQTPLRLAALAVWVVTASAGAYLLWGWLAHVGLRRRPGRAAGVPPVVILGHFGLAVTGLGLWIAFVASGQAVLAWIAASLLLPIAGLGMATLVTALPEPALPVEPAEAGPEAGGGGLATRIAASATPRVRLPVTVIALHGALATATMLLVLLAAIGAS
jgi:manganese efflux pump family protein